MKIRKEFRTPSLKRWLPACRCSRRGTAEFPRQWKPDVAERWLTERDYQALAVEMEKMTRSPRTFAEMGVLASESVAAHFEQAAQIALLEAHYQEAAEIAEEAEARETADQPVVRQSFAERVPVK